MPVKRGQDKQGRFYQWGTDGKRYYYRPEDESSRKRARARATMQGRAIAAREGGYGSR